MSRGGRGGGRGRGRGGRGGGGGGRPDVPWDTGEEPDARPSELFPPYQVPEQRPLTVAESSSVKHLLLLRHQLHSSALYTSSSKRQASIGAFDGPDPTAPRKAYGQDQTNAQYGVRSKALQDPFTAMPTYSQRFIREERTLPDWSRRPVCRELFPREILDVIEPEEKNGGTPRKRRKLELSRVNALPDAREAFAAINGEEEDYYDEDGQPNSAAGRKLALERLDALGEEGDGDALGDEDGPGEDEEEEDVAYDDEDAGDYDAENYFDNGDDGVDDYGDDGDNEGTY